MTVGVGSISGRASTLLRVTSEALAALDRVRENRRAGVGPGARGASSTSEANGFSVVREFVGHGIGTSLHEEPQIPNYGEPGHGPRLRAGMVLAIEPMVNMGQAAVRVLDDGWTAVTQDGSLSAHFEHTICHYGRTVRWSLSRPNERYGRDAVRSGVATPVRRRGSGSAMKGTNIRSAHVRQVQRSSAAAASSGFSARIRSTSSGKAERGLQGWRESQVSICRGRSGSRWG